MTNILPPNVNTSDEKKDVPPRDRPAEKAVILAPSLTRMLRALEERGFIIRHKDKDDGRRVLLTLAPAGQAIIDEAMPDSRRVYADIDARFGVKRTDNSSTCWRNSPPP